MPDDPNQNPPANDPPPASDPPLADAGATELAAAVARAEAAEVKLAGHDAAAKKAGDAAKAKDAKDRADKMIADGNASEEIKRLQGELDTATGKIEATEKSQRDAIDAKIGGLSEADQAEINAIKEHLPMAKLEELVGLKSKAEPAPAGGDTGGGGPTPGGGRMSKGRTLSEPAADICDRLGVDTSMVGKTIKVVNPNNPIQTKSKLPVKVMMDELKKLAPPTVRLSVAEARRRRGQG